MTILERDIRDLAPIEGLTALPRLLALLAARTAGLVNFAELARSLGMPPTTLKRYLVGIRHPAGPISVHVATQNRDRRSGP
jgi:predicted AAA+ superfamily ATPase